MNIILKIDRYYNTDKKVSCLKKTNLAPRNYFEETGFIKKLDLN